MGNISGRFANPDDWEYLLSRFDEQGKLFWLYINQRCEITGVHQLHYPVDSAYLGFQVNESFVEGFLQEVNNDKERVQRLEGQRLWLLGYIRFQQKPKGGPLSEKSGPHIKVVRELKKHGLFEQAVNQDPELFKNYRNPLESNEIPYNYSNDSLPVEQGKGYSSSNGNSSGNGSSDSTGPPPANCRKREPLFTVAERVLTAWPSGPSDVMFDETNVVEEILKDAQSKGIPISDAESSLKAYLKGERMRVMETEEDRDLIDILESFSLSEMEFNRGT